MLRVIIILDLAFFPESLDALEVSEDLAELPFFVPTLEYPSICGKNSNNRQRLRRKEEEIAQGASSVVSSVTRIVIDFVRLLIIPYRLSRLVTSRARACSCTESGSAPIAGVSRARTLPREPRVGPRRIIGWFTCSADVHLHRERTPDLRFRERASERCVHLVIVNAVNAEDRRSTSTLSRTRPRATWPASRARLADRLAALQESKRYRAMNLAMLNVSLNISQV